MLVHMEKFCFDGVSFPCFPGVDIQHCLQVAVALVFDLSAQKQFELFSNSLDSVLSIFIDFL